jgi:hypothetical protein
MRENLLRPQVLEEPVELDRSESVPWYLQIAVLSVMLIVFGFYWDVSWHRSIGRDTFWTPAHVCIYLGDVFSAAAAAILILRATFSRAGATGVRVLGFRGPLGAFITLWGALTQLTSAPFDDWWHNAYGLDVTIWSPPHILAAIGLSMVVVGQLVLASSSSVPRDVPSGSTRLTPRVVAILVMGAFTVSGLIYMLAPVLGPRGQHTPLFLLLFSAIVPMPLIYVAGAAGYRWSVTAQALGYMLYVFTLIAVFPLFPAEPRLGPVYHRVTHLLPPGFPLLLVFHGLAADLILRRTPESAGAWRRALYLGCVFVFVTLLVQWPFASFLTTDMAKNRFFGMIYPGSAFFRAPSHPVTPVSFLHILKWVPPVVLIATLTSWLGLQLGAWLRRVRR